MSKIAFLGFGEVNTPVDVIVRKCSAAEAASEFLFVFLHFMITS